MVLRPGTQSRKAVSKLSMIPHSPTIWSIWIYLPSLARLFVVVLSIVALYSLFSAGLVVVRLNSLTRAGGGEDEPKLKIKFVALKTRVANMRQVLGVAFYFFGFVFFVGMQSAYKTLDDSHIPMGTLILDYFLTYFVFAANVFFAFLTLHCVQWIVSIRMRSCAIRLKM
jgi:hypothetical protein